MSLPYAILGFLSYRPMTGYDLGNFFKQSVAHFWHAELSQIYRELGKLEEKGLVKSEIQPQESR
ncbi:MAG: PadR family transcriptional regulator, partial [Syntrophothermus sp.]